MVYTWKLGDDNEILPNKTCIMAQLNILKDRLKDNHCVVFVHKSQVANLVISNILHIFYTSKIGRGVWVLCTHTHTPLPIFFVPRNLILTVAMTDHLTDTMMVEITANVYYHDHDSCTDGSNDGCFSGCIDTSNSISNTYKSPKP